jgi:hypothetical protein
MEFGELRFRRAADCQARKSGERQNRIPITIQFHFSSLSL